MKTAFPDDCGNSPRVAIVNAFVRNWAAGNSDAIAEWLAEDVCWAVMGRETFHGPIATVGAHPQLTPQFLEIRSAITHGRFAACDGYTTTNDVRTNFCHMFRFTGAAKNAKVVEIRTYLT